MTEVPPYVTCLIDAFVTGTPLNFRGHEVPEAVQRRLEAEIARGRMTVHGVDTVEIAYEPGYWGEQAPERGGRESSDRQFLSVVMIDENTDLEALADRVAKDLGGPWSDR